MVKKSAIITGALILAFALVTTSCTPEADSVTPSDFYRGKTIDLTTTGSAGTFNDLSARVIASYLAEDTKANVTINNRKGVGGLEGVNYVYKARPDGLTLGTTASVKFITNKVMDEPVAEYTLDNFYYIMSLDRQPYCFFIAPEGPFQSVADLKAGQDLKIGATSPSGATSLGGLTVVKLLGLDAKVITGFGGVSGLPMPTERGEIVGYCLSISNAKANVEAGIVEPLFVLATERTPFIPNVPAITELVNLTGEDLELVELWGSTFAASNLVIAPPDVPEDRVNFLRGLANQWVQEEGFRAEIDQVANYEVQTYLTGEELTQEIMDTVAKLDQFQAVFIDLIEQYRV